MTDPSKLAFKPVLDAIGRCLESRGYQRRGHSWSRTYSETVVLIALDKSPWGEKRYMDISIFIKKLLPVLKTPFPLKEHHGHIRFRPDALVPEWRNKSEHEIDLTRWLDPMNDMPLQHRISVITTFLENVVLPFLEQCGSIESLRSLHQAHRSSWALMHWQAREVLDSIGA